VFRRSIGQTGEDGLAIIGADGSGLRWLVQGADAPSWSVDGRIVFAKGGVIWTIRPDGSGLTQLIPAGDGHEPKWSYDGTRLLFVRSVGNPSGTASDIVVSRSDGSDARTLVTGGFNVNASWSPDGLFILYEHLDFGDVAAPKCTLYKIPSTGGSSVNLTPNRGVGYCGGASWRPF
jgi:tricorn protease-like protein